MVIRRNRLSVAFELEQRIALANVDLRQAVFPVVQWLAFGGLFLFRRGQGLVIGRQSGICRAGVELRIPQQLQIQRRCFDLYQSLRNIEGAGPLLCLHSLVIESSQRFRFLFVSAGGDLGVGRQAEEQWQ